MGSNESLMYRYQIRSAGESYRKHGNWDDYMSDCTYIMLHYAASALAQKNPQLAHLPGGIAMSQHGVKAAAAMISENLRCPNDHNLDHYDFLTDFWTHGKHQIDRDPRLKTAKEVISWLGIA